MADEVLQQGVRGITDLMVMPGLINLDFADVRSVMGEMGKAMMGTGEASGDNRAIEAAEKAISNPLLDGVSMKGAKGVIISITGGEDMRLMEVDEAASHIKELVDPDANIIWGSAFNNDLEGKIRVSGRRHRDRGRERAPRPQPGKVFSFPAATRHRRPRSAAPTPAADRGPTRPATTTTARADRRTTRPTNCARQRRHPDPAGRLGPGRAAGRRGADADARSTATWPTTRPSPSSRRDSGTLFERMSNIARGAAQAEGEDGEPVPSFRREPLDIPASSTARTTSKRRLRPLLARRGDESSPARRRAARLAAKPSPARLEQARFGHGRDHANMFDSCRARRACLPRAGRGCPAIARRPRNMAPVSAAAADPGAALADALVARWRSAPRNFQALIAAGRAALDLGDTQAAAGFFGRAEEVCREARAQDRHGRGDDPDGRCRGGADLFRPRRRRSARRRRRSALDRGLAYDLLGQQAAGPSRLSRRDVRRAGRRGAAPAGAQPGISGDIKGAAATLEPLLVRRDRGGGPDQCLRPRAGRRPRRRAAHDRRGDARRGRAVRAVLPDAAGASRRRESGGGAPRRIPQGCRAALCPRRADLLLAGAVDRQQRDRRWSISSPSRTAAQGGPAAERQAEAAGQARREAPRRRAARCARRRRRQPTWRIGPPVARPVALCLDAAQDRAGAPASTHRGGRDPTPNPDRVVTADPLAPARRAARAAAADRCRGRRSTCDGDADRHRRSRSRRPNRSSRRRQPADAAKDRTAAGPPAARSSSPSQRQAERAASVKPKAEGGTPPRSPRRSRPSPRKRPRRRRRPAPLGPAGRAARMPTGWASSIKTHPRQEAGLVQAAGPAMSPTARIYFRLLVGPFKSARRQRRIRQPA